MPWYLSFPVLMVINIDNLINCHRFKHVLVSYFIKKFNKYRFTSYNNKMKLRKIKYCVYNIRLIIVFQEHHGTNSNIWGNQFLFLQAKILKFQNSYIYTKGIFLNIRGVMAPTHVCSFALAHGMKFQCYMQVIYSPIKKIEEKNFFFFFFFFFRIKEESVSSW